MINSLKRNICQLLVATALIVAFTFPAAAKEIKLPGTAKVYEHTSPDFSISYPADWKIQSKNAEKPYVLFRVYTQNEYEFPEMDVRTSNLAETATKKDIENEIINFEKKEYPEFKPRRFFLLSQEDITLSDGTPAIVTKMQYSTVAGATYVYQINVFKNGISLRATMYWEKGRNNELSKYADTFVVK